MSFDLAVFSARQTLTVEDARAAYEHGCAEGMTGLEPDERIARFVAEITSEWPQLGDLQDDEIDDSPWAASFDISPAHVISPISPGWLDEVVPTYLRAASAWGLYVYDPQEDELHSPAKPLPPEIERTDKRAFVRAVDDAIRRELAPLGFRPHYGVYARDLEGSSGAVGWLALSRGLIDFDGSHEVNSAVGVHYPAYDEFYNLFEVGDRDRFLPAVVMPLEWDARV